MKHIKLFEDACATMGNSNGMGAVVAPTVSAIPGDVAGSTPGSGDRVATFGKAYTKFPANMLNPKKSKRKRIKKFSDYNKNDN